MESTLPLRDIHLPAELGSWPPALGWWLLPLLVAMICFGLYKLYRHLTRKTAGAEAAKLLRAIAENTEVSDIEKVRQLSVLLRRRAIALYPDGQVAGLTGEDWLRFLDHSLQDEPFRSGNGRLLIDAPFRSTLPERSDILALIELCQRWLEAQK